MDFLEPFPLSVNGLLYIVKISLKMKKKKKTLRANIVNG